MSGARQGCFRHLPDTLPWTTAHSPSRSSSTDGHAHILRGLLLFKSLDEFFHDLLRIGRIGGQALNRRTIGLKSLTLGKVGSLHERGFVFFLLTGPSCYHAPVQSEVRMKRKIMEMRLIISLRSQMLSLKKKSFLAINWMHLSLEFCEQYQLAQ